LHIIMVATMSYQRRYKSYYYYYAFHVGKQVVNMYACGGREGLYLAREMERARAELRLARQQLREAETADKEARRAAKSAGRPSGRRKSQGRESAT